MLAWSTILGSAPCSQGSLVGQNLAPTYAHLPPWLALNNGEAWST